MNINSSFGECLQTVLRQQNITASALSRIMNHRSRNTVFRALHDDMSHKNKERFLQQLERTLPLTSSQKEALFIALKAEQIGRETFLCNQAMETIPSTTDVHCMKWLEKELL